MVILVILAIRLHIPSCWVLLSLSFPLCAHTHTPLDSLLRRSLVASSVLASCRSLTTRFSSPASNPHIRLLFSYCWSSGPAVAPPEYASVTTLIIANDDDDDGLACPLHTPLEKESPPHPPLLILNHLAEILSRSKDPLPRNPNAKPQQRRNLHRNTALNASTIRPSPGNLGRRQRPVLIVLSHDHAQAIRNAVLAADGCHQRLDVGGPSRFDANFKSAQRVAEPRDPCFDQGASDECNFDVVCARGDFECDAQGR